MNPKKLKKIISFFKNEFYIAASEDLKKNGINSRNLAELIENRFITKLKQGIYIWNDRDFDIPHIIIANKLIPRGVFCLHTSAEYYGLAEATSDKIYMALKRGKVAPELPVNFNINTRQMMEKHYELGKTEGFINKTPIKIYDMEKTVCDYFKYEKEVGRANSLEVLKNYMKHKDYNPSKLLEYAEIMGKLKTVNSAVEEILLK